MSKKSPRNSSRISEIKDLTPKQNFYNLYSEEQVCDIINNLETHHEIPRQYNYFGRGAECWEEYIKCLDIENDANSLTGTVELLRINRDYIDGLLKDYSNVNVVDIGAGNAYPVRGLLEHLLNQGKLNRYVALDISPSMLKLAERNIVAWFNDDVVFKSCLYDVNRDRFSDSFISKTQKGAVGNAINLVLLFGGTLSNMRYPNNAYKMVHSNMTIDDILVHATKLDTESSRKYFDFNAPSNTRLSTNHTLIFELLNIDESIYDVEMGYDPMLKERYIRVRLRIAIKIRFTSKCQKRHVFLQKGDTILVWRGIQHSKDSIVNQFDKNGFHILHTSQTDNQDYMLTVSRAVH